jgi:hypothetical protein
MVEFRVLYRHFYKYLKFPFSPSFHDFYKRLFNYSTISNFSNSAVLQRLNIVCFMWDYGLSACLEYLYFLSPNEINSKPIVKIPSNTTKILFIKIVAVFYGTSTICFKCTNMISSLQNIIRTSQ